MVFLTPPDKYKIRGTSLLQPNCENTMAQYWSNSALVLEYSWLSTRVIWAGLLEYFGLSTGVIRL